MNMRKERKRKEELNNAIIYELTQTNLIMSNLLQWAISTRCDDVEKYCPTYMRQLNDHTKALRDLSTELNKR